MPIFFHCPNKLVTTLFDRVYERFFRIRFPGTFVPVASWLRVYIGRGGCTRVKNRSTRHSLDIHTHTYFSGSLTFPFALMTDVAGFQQRMQARGRSSICSRMRNTRVYSHAGPFDTYSSSTRAALYSISTTVARKRADVFFFGNEMGSVQWGIRMKWGTITKPVYNPQWCVYISN